MFKRPFMTLIVISVATLFLAGCSGAPAELDSKPDDRVLGKEYETYSGDFGVAKSSEAAASPEAAAPLEAAVPLEATRSEAATGMPAPSPATRGDVASSAASPAPGYAPVRTPPSSSGLKAGFSDDNAQFNYFIEFLAKYADVEHYPYDIAERLSLRVLDATGKSVPNAEVSISALGRILTTGVTYADGGFRIYPAALTAGAVARQVDSFDVAVKAGTLQGRATVRRDGPRSVEIRLSGKRSVPAPIPLDVLFVMDTTGSMGEEIERLRATIEIIYANLNALKPRPVVRFGMVLYKDRGDDYITQAVPFTEDLDAFQAVLNEVQAGGGGDGPEDLESALDAAINKMDWNKNGIRLGFVVTDAESHLDYGRQYTYIKAAGDARARAIKLFTIGTGGLPLEGEYLLRQISQLTDAKYIFLTYGEGGEAEGGAPGSVSHHTGSNFTTDKLEAIVIRFVKDEVAYLSDVPPVVDEDFFTADKISDETRDQTLDKLFRDTLANLMDYSTYRVGVDTPLAILPVAGSGEGTAASAEYFAERLAIAAAGMEPKRFKLVERKDLQKVLAELELQLSGLADEGSAARVGALIGADVLVSGSLYRRAENYELFLKLVRVSTAEILAVARAKIDPDLGL
ncbi:MAG: VWA domain-containing protein [Spirochaetales bacterium]|nr:MAG: VWA domain-containing protein [Spirochaetales bacterium]